MQLLHVLIIEDSDDDALLLVRALRQWGYELKYRRVQTEEAVRAALHEEKWDLVISDHAMPSFSAPAALDVIKESGLDLPFIIVSGVICEETAVALMKAGAHDFIQKGKLGRLLPVIERELRDAQTRRQQRQWEQEFKALVENAPDIVARHDRCRRYLYINPAIEKDTGISRKTFIGRTHEELKMHSKVVKLWNGAFDEVFTTARETTLRFEYLYPTGIKYYHTRLVPEFDTNGVVETVLTITRDVTEFKRMEAELLDDLAKARILHLRSLPDLPAALPGVTLHSLYLPAKQVKGDFYNLIQKNKKLIIYVANSRGNGLDGVVLSSFIQRMVEKYLQRMGKNSILPSPQKMLHFLLQHYERENPGETCTLSMLLAVLDTETGVLLHAAYDFNCAPLLVTCDGEVFELETAAQNPIQDYSRTFIKGSTLLFFTEGLLKQNGDEERSVQLLSDLLQKHRHDPPELILQAVSEGLQVTGKTSGSNDEDIAILALQRIENKQRLAMEVESDFSVIEEINKKVNLFITNHTKVKIDMLIFHELLVNAIEHGNKQDWGKRVYIDVTVGTKYYRIVIEDEGEGFNWQEQINRKLELDNYCERGRGVIMTRLLADYMSYNERGNRATMVKLI